MTVMAGAAGVPHALNALPTAAAVAVLCVLAATGPLSAHGAGPVPRRVAALLSPPPRPRLLLLAAAVALVAVSGISALEAARDLHALLAAARAATGMP